MVAEDSLKQALTQLCGDVEFYEPVSACYNRVKEILSDVSRQLAAIDLPTLQRRLDLVDSCLSIYRSTIDKKMADYTTREAELVKSCGVIDLYPPER